MPARSRDGPLMTDDPRRDDSAPLDGWKAIAEHLGKSVRTAQRWRSEFGMPVHRIGDRDREHVYAYRSELDAWRRGASHVVGPALGAFDDQADVPRESRSAEPGDSEQARPGSPKPRRAGWIAAAAAAGLAILAFAAWVASDPAVIPSGDGAPSTHGRPSPVAPSPLHAQPARYAVAGSRFLAYDLAGRFLWEYDAGVPLNIGSYVGHGDPARVPLPEADSSIGVAAQVPPVHFADIDGDGAVEVLLLAQSGDGLLHSTLHCVDARGRVRWTFEPLDELSFGGNAYGLPTFMPWVTASRDPGGTTSIWVTAHHPVEYPSITYRLSANGSVLTSYVSNGRIDKVRVADVGGRRRVMLAGVNNERKMAALAVFDLEGVGGAAPAETRAYRCDGCAPGVPDEYLVFPATSVGALRGGMPNVGEVVVTDSGDVFVSVIQHKVLLPGDASQSYAVTNYRLDASYRVIDADFGQDYAPIHDHFLSHGRTSRRFDASALAAELWPVLRWNGSAYARIERPER